MKGPKAVEKAVQAEHRPCAGALEVTIVEAGTASFNCADKHTALNWFSLGKGRMMMAAATCCVNLLRNSTAQCRLGSQLVASCCLTGSDEADRLAGWRRQDLARGSAGGGWLDGWMAGWLPTSSVQISPD